MKKFIVPFIGIFLSFTSYGMEAEIPAAPKRTVWHVRGYSQEDVEIWVRERMRMIGQRAIDAHNADKRIVTPEIRRLLQEFRQAFPTIVCGSIATTLTRLGIFIRRPAVKKVIGSVSKSDKGERAQWLASKVDNIGLSILNNNAGSRRSIELKDLINKYSERYLDIGSVTISRELSAAGITVTRRFVSRALQEFKNSRHATVAASRAEVPDTDMGAGEASCGGAPEHAPSKPPLWVRVPGPVTEETQSQVPVMPISIGWSEVGGSIAGGATGEGIAQPLGRQSSVAVRQEEGPDAGKKVDPWDIFETLAEPDKGDSWDVFQTLA